MIVDGTCWHMLGALCHPSSRHICRVRRVADLVGMGGPPPAPPYGPVRTRMLDVGHVGFKRSIGSDRMFSLVRWSALLILQIYSSMIVWTDLGVPSTSINRNPILSCRKQELPTRYPRTPHPCKLTFFPTPTPERTPSALVNRLPPTLPRFELRRVGTAGAQHRRVGAEPGRSSE